MPIPKNELEKHYQAALSEIGEVKPWWSKKDGYFVFEHPAYPTVDYLDDTEESTAEGYKRILRLFIAERLAGNLSPIAERLTSGRGGARPGAGRKKGSTTVTPTKTARLPEDIANWLKASPENIEKVRKLIAQ